MANRIRIFDLAPPYHEYGESDAFRKFKFEFSNLFEAGEIATSDKQFEAMYVPDEEFENDLNNFFKSLSSSASFCVGYTGIGKTTTIRHCLQIGTKNVPILTTPSKTNPLKRMVIFPTFLDGYIGWDINNFDLPNRIASVCTALEDAHPELYDMMNTLEGKRKFHDFISRHSSYLLEDNDDLELLSEPPEERILHRLINARKKDNLAYYATKLKFYISNEPIYDRLVILLDDVETLPEDFQRDLILSYMHFFVCMQNTDYPEDSEFCINLLISVRPHTLRILKKQIQFPRKVEARALGEAPIKKRHAVDLDKLFERRFRYYNSLSEKVVGNKDSWHECYNSLMGLSKAFSGKYKDMIVNLCFMNVRASLAYYSRIFANRFWVQNNKPKEITFGVDPNSFVFNNITVVRAIGCGDKALYTGKAPFDGNEQIIPNIFYTTPTEDYSIECLLVMKYYYTQIVTNESYCEFEYGTYAITRVETHKKWGDLFTPRQVQLLVKAEEYLFEIKILRKSINDTDDYKTLDTLTSLKQESQLYLSPRGYELFRMFDRDSVLLELLREAAYRDYTKHKDSYSTLSSYDLMRQKRQSDIFIDLLEYVDYLREIEEEYYFEAYSKDATLYFENFGTGLIVGRLLSGISNSLNYSGIIENPVVKLKYNKVLNRICEATNVE